MFCPKCGNQMQDGAAFCPKCGLKIQASVTPVPVQQNGKSAEKKKGKKGIIIAIVAILLVAGAAVALFATGVLGGKKEPVYAPTYQWLNGFEWTWSLDENGNTVSRTGRYPNSGDSFTTTYIYDNKGGKVKSVFNDGEDWDLFENEYKGSHLVSSTSTEGVVTTYTYDNNGRIAEILTETPNGAGTIYTERYIYDSSGHCISAVINNVFDRSYRVDFEYSYDSDGFVTGFTRAYSDNNSGKKEISQYTCVCDEAGNIIEVKQDGVTIRRCTYQRIDDPSPFVRDCAGLFTF